MAMAPHAAPATAAREVSGSAAACVHEDGSVELQLQQEITTTTGTRRRRRMACGHDDHGDAGGGSGGSRRRAADGGRRRLLATPCSIALTLLSLPGGVVAVTPTGELGLHHSGGTKVYAAPAAFGPTLPEQTERLRLTLLKPTG